MGRARSWCDTITVCRKAEALWQDVDQLLSQLPRMGKNGQRLRLASTKNQIGDAAESVALQLAEGAGVADDGTILLIRLDGALGELSELKAGLRFLRGRGHVAKRSVDPILRGYTDLDRKIKAEKTRRAAKKRENARQGRNTPPTPRRSSSGPNPASTRKPKGPQRRARARAPKASPRQSTALSPTRGEDGRFLKRPRGRRASGFGLTQRRTKGRH